MSGLFARGKKEFTEPTHYESTHGLLSNARHLESDAPPSRKTEDDSYLSSQVPLPKRLRQSQVPFTK